MKKVNFYALMITLTVLAIMGCNQNNKTSNQAFGEQYDNEAEQYNDNNSGQYNEEEDLYSDYILKPNVLYTGTVNGGFSGFDGEEVLILDKKNNETSFKIRIYEDGGITFDFDQKVYVEGWGWNMSGVLEGQWESGSFSHHDVEYNYVVIKCKNAITPTYYEDSNHTPHDSRLKRILIVEMLVDKDLNYYFSDNDLINHNAAGKLFTEE